MRHQAVSASLPLAEAGERGEREVVNPARSWRAEVVHDKVRGRTRFRVPALYRSEGAALELERRCQRFSGVAEAKASALSATLLVVFDPAVPRETVFRALDEELTRLEREWRAPAMRSRARRLSPAHSSRKASRPWQRLPAEEVASTLGTSPETGLSGLEAARRRAETGPNSLDPLLPPPGLSLFLSQMKSMPVALLLASAGISLLTGGVSDAAVVLGVVLTNASLGYATERRSHRLIQGLAREEDGWARVVREGRETRLPQQALVPGDVLALRPGDKVGADARLVACDDLTVDESMLSGESLPREKGLALAEATTALGAANMVFRGTMVTGGSGKAIVVATGAETEAGKIQTLLTEAEAPETPLQKELRVLGGRLVAVTMAACGFFFALGLLRRFRFLDMLKTSLSLGVAAVPEGLPAVATSTLALGVLKLRRRQVLVRKLPSIEALGAVDVVCLDKTGTLTENRMAATSLHVGLDRMRVTGTGLLKGRLPVQPSKSPELLRLLLVGALCHEGRLVESEAGLAFEGSPTEEALLQLADFCGIGLEGLAAIYPIEDREGRSESRPYMRTIHRVETGGRLHALKGRPDRVLELCSHHLFEGTPRALTPAERRLILAENRRLAGVGQRVLGFAYRMDEPGKGPGTYVWLGLVGLSDPLRANARVAVERFHRAGIRTLMLTGDQRATALAIARSLGMNGESRLKVSDARDLGQVLDEKGRARFDGVHVFSQVTPSDKFRVVKALQRGGHIVAMTGDGVNDGPALKAADVGIAMGKNGTSVARDVGDIVLREDDLESLLAAIEQGRATRQNIRKAVEFTLSTNLGEVLLAVAAMGSGVGSPLNPMQLLWINLVTDVLPALAIAVAPPDPDTMARPAPRPGEPLIGKEALSRIGRKGGRIAAASLAAYALGRSVSPMKGGTLAFATLTTSQLLHAFSVAGARRNRYLWGAVAAGFALQTAGLFLPGLRGMLGMTRLGWRDVGLCLALVGVEKLGDGRLSSGFFRRFPARGVSGSKTTDSSRRFYE